jgi:hypothetical protein
VQVAIAPSRDTVIVVERRIAGSPIRVTIERGLVMVTDSDARSGSPAIGWSLPSAG